MRQYRALGLMSGSSLDGLDLAFVRFQENTGSWSFEMPCSTCYPYPEEWKDKLQGAIGLSARDYLLLHGDYGRYLGQQVKRFIEENGLAYQVQLIASHGHTVFHQPSGRMTAQLGDGASLAAETGINVISDLRSMDMALGGQGAPIVPIGENLLFPGYRFFLNLGGIANLSFHFDAPGEKPQRRVEAYDVCPASRVLNLLAERNGKPFDENGEMASVGSVLEPLLRKLNNLGYYRQPYPKSLANEFGTGAVYGLIESSGCSVEDGLRTYVEHICFQVQRAVSEFLKQASPAPEASTFSILVTGGSTQNAFLLERLRNWLQDDPVELVVPEQAIILYKEALIMALIGVLRWREEPNTLATVTGASRDSIGGAVWIGQPA